MRDVGAPVSPPLGATTIGVDPGRERRMRSAVPSRGVARARRDEPRGGDAVSRERVRRPCRGPEPAALESSDDGLDDPKGFGYGIPFEIECTVGGAARSLVMSRTRPAQGFGHDYPADRAWQAIYGHDAYNTFRARAQPGRRHPSPDRESSASVADAAEFFQLVEKVDGTLYWRDLERLLKAPLLEPDIARAEALARFLAEVHAVKRDEPTIYQRRIRELIGHGECLMGILDSYPHPYPLLMPDVCEEIERAAVSGALAAARAAPTVCPAPTAISTRECCSSAPGPISRVLDRSRGVWGEPADDIAALAINYLFYGLRARRGRAVPVPLLRLPETYLR